MEKGLLSGWDWKGYEYLEPDVIIPEDFMDDEEKLLSEGEIIEDDIIRGSSPSQAIDWLCAMLGNRIKVLPGSTLGEEQTKSWQELKGIKIDKDNLWYKKYLMK